VEGAPVLEARVRRNDSQRFALGLIAVGIAVTIIALAIVTAALRDGRSPSATDAVAAVAGPEASLARESPPKPPPAKRATSFRPPPKPKATVAAPPVVAPESEAAEEPVPTTALLAPQLTPDDAQAAPMAAEEAPRLRISGASATDGGSVTVLVDGTPTYTCQLLGKGEPFQGEIVLTPGEHLIVARLEDGARVGVHEDSTRSLFVQGDRRLLEITANRTLESPIKVKLGRLADPSASDRASLAR
jgi:type IV secretory pathway VirB10-like protein